MSFCDPVLPAANSYFSSGGGVGGLILAVALSKSSNIDVDVYEAARELTEIGAGVGMWPRTWRILQQLGLAEELSRYAVIPPLEMPSKWR